MKPSRVWTGHSGRLPSLGRVNLLLAMILSFAVPVLQAQESPRPSGPGASPWSLRRPSPGTSQPPGTPDRASQTDDHGPGDTRGALVEMDPAPYPTLSLPVFGVPSPRNALPRTPGFGSVPFPPENLLILEIPWPESRIRVILRDPLGRIYERTWEAGDQALELLELPLPFDEFFGEPGDSPGDTPEETKGFQALAIPLYPHAHLPQGDWTLVWQRDQDPPGPEISFPLNPRSFNLCSVPEPDPFTHPDLESTGYGQDFHLLPDSPVYLTLRLPRDQEAFHVGFYRHTGTGNEFGADLYAPHRVFLLEGPWTAEERDRGWWQGQIALSREDLSQGLRIARSPGPEPGDMRLNIWDSIRLQDRLEP